MGRRFETLKKYACPIFMEFFLNKNVFFPLLIIAKRNEEITFDDLLLLNVNMRKYNHLLQEGIFDAYQRYLRNDNITSKPIRKSTNFIRAFLPTNILI
jgi:hypothetical protein